MLIKNLLVISVLITGSTQFVTYVPDWVLTGYSKPFQGEIHEVISHRCRRSHSFCFRCPAHAERRRTERTDAHAIGRARQLDRQRPQASSTQDPLRLRRRRGQFFYIARNTFRTKQGRLDRSSQCSEDGFVKIYEVRRSFSEGGCRRLFANPSNFPMWQLRATPNFHEHIFYSWTIIVFIIFQLNP